MTSVLELSTPVTASSNLGDDNEVNESEKVYFHSGSQPTYRKVNKATSTSPFTIPIIDISNINSPSLETRKVIAKEIYDACSTCGFFYLKNHGLGEELAEQTFALMKRFFALDLDIKMDAFVHKNPAIRGYEPMMHNNMGKGDLKEAFTMGDCALEPEQSYQAKTNSLPPPITKPQNIWPSQAPWFREGLYKYYQAIFPLALKLVSLFALAFDLEEDAFDHMFKFPITGMRPLFYPSQISDIEGKGEEVMGLGAHADFSYLTLLLQDPSTPALEILPPSATWISAPPVPSTLLCNVGQYLSHHTSSAFPATVHRVRNLSSNSRYSLPFFLTPDPDALLEPLACCLIGKEGGEEGEKRGFGSGKVNVGEMYVRRVLSARKSHPTSVRYRDVPEEEWRYDFLLG